ncbi:MAG: HDOD domain-containing protein [Myxococcota bacterium]
MPVLPGVIVRLVSLSPNGEAYFDEVLSLAVTDPPLAARIISAANAADSSPVCPIETLRDAVARLGGKRIG